MNTNTPIVKRAAWSYTIVQLLLMAGLMLLLWRGLFPYNFNLAMLYGALAYLAYSFASKATLLGHHRKGIEFIKSHSFCEAITEFESSYMFLSRYAWVDKYRFIIMLDSSAIEYREMALCNIAYSYIQLGDKDKARDYYQRALQENPDSDLAKGGIEYLAQERIIGS